MANFINIYSSITAYNADETKEYPNVSYLETEDMVKWQATEPIDQEYVVAKYDVTTTTAATKILGSNVNITYMIVDGVQQSSVVNEYTFSTTGTHTVKYKVNSNWDGNTAFNFCATLTSVTIPDSVTSIDAYAFQDAYGLAKVILGSGITSIGQRAFQNCRSLPTITISDNITSIGQRVFMGCTGLTSVTIPDSVTSIGERAFGDCSSLTSITVNATTPPTLGASAFNSTNNCPIYVPAASVNAYKTASVWSTYASRIQPIQ